MKYIWPVLIAFLSFTTTLSPAMGDGPTPTPTIDMTSMLLLEATCCEHATGFDAGWTKPIGLPCSVMPTPCPTIAPAPTPTPCPPDSCCVRFVDYVKCIINSKTLTIARRCKP